MTGRFGLVALTSTLPERCVASTLAFQLPSGDGRKAIYRFLDAMNKGSLILLTGKVGAQLLKPSEETSKISIYDLFSARVAVDWFKRGSREAN